MLEFAGPAWLLLLPVPIAVWLAWRRLRRVRHKDQALLHPLADLIGQLGEPPSLQRVPWSWLLGCALLVIAMARPQWVDRTLDQEPGRNLVIAIDASGSMRALDYVDAGGRISRLDMVKRAIERFLSQARNLRVGLVVFADQAMPFMPLTTDLPLAAAMVDEIDHGLAGERTALGDAVALSIKRMQALEGSRGARALVLMTDGIATAGTLPLSGAAELARAEGIRIYTVGIGTEGKVPFPRALPEDPTYTELPLDEAALKDAAARTGGEYFRIRETADMDRVLARINALEAARIPVPAEGEDWSWLPAIAGLLVLVWGEYGRRPRVLPA